MFTIHTLLPNLQMVHPLPVMDKEHLTDEDLDIFHTEWPTVLIVDLRGTRNMDSEGMSWLVNLQILMADQKKTLLLLSPTSAVTNLLRTAGIEQHFLTTKSMSGVQEIITYLHPELFNTRIIPGH